MKAPLYEDTSGDRKSTRLNSSHGYISYAVFCLKKTAASRAGPERAQHVARPHVTNSDLYATTCDFFLFAAVSLRPSSLYLDEVDHFPLQLDLISSLEIPTKQAVFPF